MFIILRIESSAITHIGLVRTNNEDNYYINGKCRTHSEVVAEGYTDDIIRPSYLYGWFDVMGGSGYGKLASMFGGKTPA